jgi:hypothetical protein
VKFHIGDLVWLPHRRRGYIWKWSPGIVIATRGDKVIVADNYGYGRRSHFGRFEREYDVLDLQPRKRGNPTGMPVVPQADYNRAWQEPLTNRYRWP